MMTISLDRILQKNCFPAAVLCACALPSKHYLRSFFKTSFSVVISSDMFPHVNICVITCVYFIRDGRGNFLHDMPFDFWQKYTYAYQLSLQIAYYFCTLEMQTKNEFWSSLYNLCVYTTKCTRQFRSLVFLCSFFTKAILPTAHITHHKCSQPFVS